MLDGNAAARRSRTCKARRRRCIRCSRRWSSATARNAASARRASSCRCSRCSAAATGDRRSTAAHRRRARRQSLPLHRLRPDPRGGAAHAEPAAEPRARSRPRAAETLARLAGAGRRRDAWRSGMTGTAILRAGDASTSCADSARASGGAHRRRRDRCRPVGHQAACASSTRSSLSAGCASCRRIEDRRDALELGAGVTYADAHGGARAPTPGSRRAGAPLRRRRRSATPARSAATSPTARRSATARRR